MSNKSKSKREGPRPDGRYPEELRKPYVVKAGVIERAQGSAMVQSGKTIAIAAVYGPKKVVPKHLEDQEKAILRCRYNMLSFSVKDRKRPGPDKRSIEIGKVVTEALSNILFLEEYPRTLIDVDLEIIQADAGTRVAALTAASVALADAGIAMRTLMPSVAVGRANGMILVDLNKEEEDAEDAVDMPLAMSPITKEITLMQMDGVVEIKDLKKMLALGEKAMMEIYSKQRDALKNKYDIAVQAIEDTNIEEITE